MNDLKKKEMAIPAKLFAIIFSLTLFMCLGLETVSEYFPSRRTYDLFIVIWQLIFGGMALINLKRTAIYYLFCIPFFMAIAVTCILFSFFVLYPFITNIKAYIALFLFIGTVLNFYLGYLNFGYVFEATLDGNIASGRIDLNQGSFSFSVPPKMYEYNNPKMRMMSYYLMANMGIIAFVGPAIFFYVNEFANANLKDILGAVSVYLMGMVFVWAMSGAFYNYRWITAWERARGRIMFTKYFDAKSI